MSSCFGWRKKGNPEHEPLLPQYEDDTTLQRQLHAKLHTYQQFRALGRGYLPSNEQAIINLRTLLASDVLNLDPSTTDSLSETGRRLIKLIRQFITQLITLLQNKNGRDQIQDLIYALSKSRVWVDTGDLAARARKSKAKADAAATWQSVRTVGTLVLGNDDFRVFLADLNTVGREVFRDSAFKLSGVAKEVGKEVEPDAEEQRKVAQVGADGQNGVPSAMELEQQVLDVGKVVANGSAEVTKTAVKSTQEKLTGDEGKVMLNRLKQAVTQLRKRDDYSQSVSTLSLLIKRYAMVYSRAAQEVSDIAEEDTHQNEQVDRAMKNAWLLVTSFGDKAEWDKCEELYQKVLSHRENDPQFEGMMQDVGDSLQKLLTDPAFFDNAQAKLDELRAKSEKAGTDSDLGNDVNALLKQIDTTLRSVLNDPDIHNLIATSASIVGLLAPNSGYHNDPTDLLRDGVNHFLPLLISAIQYLPIPRLEVSTPEIDLLLENLILEPGKTINSTSFLPYRLKVETYNDFELRKARFGTTTAVTSLMTIKLDGLSVRAEEMGFWLRAHSGILRLADEGIASFALDDRGIDIHVDVEICRERLEQILTLKAVRVHIHKLQYTLRKSKFSFFAWIFKPLLRPIVRKTIERQVAAALADMFHSANRELLYARERLRATRIANPNDLMTFFKAIAARLTPEEDPDLYSRVGVAEPGKGVFKGVYAPGSLVKVWHEEGERAGELVKEWEEGGWRNEVFDIHTRNMS